MGLVPEIEIGLRADEIGAGLERRIGIVEPQPLDGLHRGSGITLSEIQVRETQQGVVRPGRGAVLDDHALQTRRRCLRIGREHALHIQGLRVHRILRREGGEEPAHDRPRRVGAAVLRQLDRSLEPGVGLGG